MGDVDTTECHSPLKKRKPVTHNLDETRGHYAKGNEPDTEKTQSGNCMWNLKVEATAEERMPAARGWGAWLRPRSQGCRTSELGTADVSLVTSQQAAAGTPNLRGPSQDPYTLDAGDPIAPNPR